MKACHKLFALLTVLTCLVGALAVLPATGLARTFPVGGKGTCDVNWLHESRIMVNQVMLDHGTEAYRFSYTLVNESEPGICSFMIWTREDPTAYYTWEPPRDDWEVIVAHLDDVLPMYDARNLDPSLNWIVYTAPPGEWPPPPDRQIQPGEQVMGFGYVANEFGPEPVYYGYETEESIGQGKDRDEEVAAVAIANVSSRWHHDTEGQDRDIHQAAVDPIDPLLIWGVPAADVDLILVDDQFAPAPPPTFFDDNGFLWAAALIFAAQIPGVDIQDAYGVVDYVDKINAKHTAVGHGLNVILVGHGSEAQIAIGDGLGAFADDRELHMGGVNFAGHPWKWEWDENRDFFEFHIGVDKICRLLLLGCEIARGADGLAFIQHLADELECEVCAFDAVVWARSPVPLAGLPGQFSVCEGGQLWGSGIPTSVERTTWGGIKGMYR